MNSRERFRKTMAYEQPDRVPYFQEGIRKEVLKAWRKQGLPRGAKPETMFPCDRRLEIEVDLEPRPGLSRWPATRKSLEKLRQRLDPCDPGRLPDNWSQLAACPRDYPEVRMLKIHRGFFLSLGVMDWKRFLEVMYLLMEAPDVVREAMQIQGEFAAGLASRVLQEMEVDAAVFSEPIGGNDRPLISPRMYEDIVLRSYEPVLDVLRRFAVKTIIFRTYANARLLIPNLLKHGFNCLWACEVDLETMDYRSIRREFGRDLRLIGGIDLDALRHGQDAIRREVIKKVPPLLADGGYVPLADGRIREDVTYPNYVYYRKLLEQITR
jgi:Uroporphyrinogen decarboxylase (URO-D)